MRKALLAAAMVLVTLGAVGCGRAEPEGVSRFLASDPAQERAVLALLADMPGGPPGNFDGYTSGSLLVRIPVGWTLIVDMRNLGRTPHSAAVVASPRGQVPLGDAHTYRPRAGTPPGSGSGFSWRALRAGTYAIKSLVPGDEARGMWVTLVVVARGRPSIAVVRRGG